MTSKEIKWDDWVLIPNDPEKVFTVEMVDSFGRVKVSAWFEPGEVRPY